MWAFVFSLSTPVYVCAAYLLMKKVFIAIIIVLILLLGVGGIYVYIPSTLTVSANSTLHGTVTGSSRALLQKEKWKTFWAGKKELTPNGAITVNDLFIYNEDTFRIAKLLQNALAITISSGTTRVNSMLRVLPAGRDSVGINWTYNDTTSNNPINRLKQYQQAVTTKKNMDAVLQHITQFLSTNKNVYGISIEQTTTHDTTLISIYSILNKYPTTDDIYALVKKLQAYIDANKALQTGSPMLNITQLDSQRYKVRVALPTNKILNEQGNISYNRMIPGDFLSTTITGGSATVDNACRQMQYYFEDYKRTAMAIPFQVLVTDRSKEADTSKWITKLYFPVM